MGRAGRTEPGICYHFYTKDDFENKMEKFPQPDIRVSDLAGPSLKLLSLDSIKDVKTLISIYSDFIEPPRENYIKSAVNQLIQLGAIQLDGVTPLGKYMADVNLDPMPALFVLLGKIYECSNEIINIIAMMDAIRLNMGSLLKSPLDIVKNNPKLKEDKQKYERTMKYLQEKYDKARSKFKHKYGDHMSLLNIFDKYVEVSDKDDFQKLNDWAYKHFLNLDPIAKAKKYAKKMRRNINRKLPRDLKAADLGIPFEEKILKLPPDDRVMTCLLIAYSINKANKKDKDIYRTKHHKEKISLDKNSFLRLNKTLPKEVIYSELFISMGRAELNIVSKIPNDLSELALSAF